MRIPKRRVIIGSIVLFAALILATWIMLHDQDVERSAQYVNSVLAIRGFRHNELKVLPGELGDYEVEVGEEFKVTWKTVNLSEDGQLIYQGPQGVGAGMIRIPFQNLASQSAPFLRFIPGETGTATFALTTTGPGPDGIYTLTSALTVRIR